MKHYQRILLALDLHPENDAATEERAQELQLDNGAELYLVHAVGHISSYGAAYAYSILSDLEGHLLLEAKTQLLARAKALDVKPQNAFVEAGPVKPIILETAKRIKADLIIVGSHTHHGYHLLFQSTADSILHDAQCDVLAVKLKSGTT